MNGWMIDRRIYERKEQRKKKKKKMEEGKKKIECGDVDRNYKSIHPIRPKIIPCWTSRV